MVSRLSAQGGAVLLALVVLAGCNGRDRLTFPDPGDGIGPVITITQPAQDTTITAGPGIFVAGHVVDKDGVDTLNVEVVNGNQQFLPLTFTGRDSVRFDLPISTGGKQMGDTIQVVLRAVDGVGNTGAPVGRVLLFK
jgi:hypothetical protein